MIDFTVVFTIFCVLLGLILIMGVKMVKLHHLYCTEYRKRKVRDTLLESTRQLLTNTDCVSGVCGCGAEMHNHQVWDNHSPIDMGKTAQDHLLIDIEAVLGKIDLELDQTIMYTPSH